MIHPNAIGEYHITIRTLSILSKEVLILEEALMLLDIYDSLRNGKEKPYKGIQKLGTVKIDVVETTPVVWKGALIRFEWVRNSKHQLNGHTVEKEGYYHFVNMQTEEEVGRPFGYGHSFGCCHNENGRMFVHGVRGNGGGSVLDGFWSDDLENWQEFNVFTFDQCFRLFNTSVCKGPDELFYMAIENGGIMPEVGARFTNFFARSSDLVHWNLMDIKKYVYAKERYTACPVIRYNNGWFYMIYLESLPCHRWVPYIVRTKDFAEYELGIRNPVMWFDESDKILYNNDWFTAEEKTEIVNSIDCNNSDIDLCEYEGKTVIVYSWGNQLGREYLARAVYDGPMSEFFESFF